MRRHRGFTLLELIIVIGLMGVASTMGTVVLFKVFGIWQGVTQRAALEAKADTIAADMRATLLAGQKAQGFAITCTGKAAAGAPPEDRLVMVNVAAQAEAVYEINRELPVPRLLFKQTINGATAERVVAEGVMAFCVESLPRQAGASWQRDWQQNELPAALRVTLVVGAFDQPRNQILRRLVVPVCTN